MRMIIPCHACSWRWPWRWCHGLPWRCGYRRRLPLRRCQCLSGRRVRVGLCNWRFTSRPCIARRLTKCSSIFMKFFFRFLGYVSSFHGHLFSVGSLESECFITGDLQNNLYNKFWIFILFLCFLKKQNTISNIAICKSWLRFIIQRSCSDLNILPETLFWISKFIT